MGRCEINNEIRSCENRINALTAEMEELERSLQDGRAFQRQFQAGNDSLFEELDGKRRSLTKLEKLSSRIKSVRAYCGQMESLLAGGSRNRMAQQGRQANEGIRLRLQRLEQEIEEKRREISNCRRRINSLQNELREIERREEEARRREAERREAERREAERREAAGKSGW